jgi:LytR cell envelope-related transcriptional attenuator
MSPPDVEQSSSVMASAPQRISDRRRRQTYTFLGLFGIVVLIGLVALGNWLQWWTLGGEAQAVSVSCPVQVVSDPSLTRVNVYNGTGRSGLATSVARELQKRKFHVLVIGTERPAKPLNTIAQIRYGDPGTQAAHTIALEFPGKVLLVNDARDTKTVDLVLGERYKGMQTRAKAVKAIKPKSEPDGCVMPATTTASSATTAAS